MSLKKDWYKEYQAKVVDPQDVGDLLHSGDRVFLGSCCGEPQTLVETLVKKGEELNEVEIVNVSPPRGSSLYAQEALYGHLKLCTFFGNPSTKKAIKEGRGDYIPCHLSGIPSLFYDGYLHLDVAMIQVSPPDEYGYCSFGISVDCTKAAAEKARIVIAEVNSQMPRTLGDSFIHVSEIDYLIETSRPLISIELDENLTDEEKAIAENVAKLVPDEATLSLGYGKIMDAILIHGLVDKKELGIHTGSISDGVLKLTEMGVITNSRKTIDRDRIVTTMAMGTDRLYRFCHNNPFIEMHPITYTHNIVTLSQFENFISINSAFQVDLYGQANAEILGDYHIGGTGGQVDFIRGSKQSKGGKSIICLSSTTQNGDTSRIVPSFDKYTPTTSLRSDIDYIVTEIGIAELKGKPMRERTASLLKIAHPNFRKQLQREFLRIWP